MNGEDPRRASLGEFLRACRARVQPHEAGIADDGRRRRVPGLRREELAGLAHVSVDYLVRLEQGRDTNVSHAVLQALADALRLRRDEREYLFRIGQPGDQAGTRAAPVQLVRTQTRRLLDGLAEMPALVLGRRLDVLAWNTMGAALLGDFAVLPAPRRNLVWLAFKDPAYRELYGEWAKSARSCVAYLRMDAGRDPDDLALKALVEELSDDADFRRWWEAHQVRTWAFGRKTVQHPVAGRMRLDFQTLTTVEDPGQTILVFSAEPGTPAHEALRFLGTWPLGEQPAPSPAGTS